MKGKAISVLSLDISENMGKFVRSMIQAHIFTAKFDSAKFDSVHLGMDV